MFIGHTMGTPGMEIAEAAAVFAQIGCSGTEAILRDGHPMAPGITDEEVKTVAEAARAAGAPLKTITPYAWGINEPDPAVARTGIDALKRAIDIAVISSADFIRAYSGKEFPEGDPVKTWDDAVAALQESGEYALSQGITILVENHPGTKTRTGTDTRKMIDAVASPAVRALYDPANVLHDTDEDWETTLNVQLGTIGYVHVKDFYMNGDTRVAAPVGKGSVPWDAIIPLLLKDGFDGCFSFEYEKMYNMDILPDAEVGMKESLEYIQALTES